MKHTLNHWEQENKKLPKESSTPVVWVSKVLRSVSP